MHKYIQKKLDEERWFNARKAATTAFNDVLKTKYVWPITTNWKGESVVADEDGYYVVPSEMIELLLEKKLASKYPKKRKYKLVQKLFDEIFDSWQNTTEHNAQKELRTKNITISVISMLALIVGLCFIAYHFNFWLFKHDFVLNGDGYFTIEMPGNYTVSSNTLGTADAPLFRKIYTYDNKSENNRLNFRVVEDNYPAAFSDKQINDLFLKSPESNLIQNYGSNSNGFKETVEEEIIGTYAGYPSIDATKRTENINVMTYLRYVHIGHIIYEISMTGDNYFNDNYKDIFNRYANTFKILLNDQVKG